MDVTDDSEKQAPQGTLLIPRLACTSCPVHLNSTSWSISKGTNTDSRQWGPGVDDFLMSEP